MRLSVPCRLLLSLVPVISPAATEPPPPPVQHAGAPAALAPGWAHYNQGLDRLAAFDLAAALAAFDAACAQAPKQADYAAARALALLLQQRVAEGREAIARATAMGPASRMTQGIGTFAAGLAGDRAGALKYPRPQNDFEWFFFRIGENLTAANPSHRLSLDQAQRQFPRIATEFARLQMQDVGGDRALLARGLQRRADRDFAGAVSDLAEYAGRHPDDRTARYHHATALADAGNLERARRELSLVLCGQPALFEGYTQRAIAAARMGNLMRAKQDLATARRLDPKDRAALGLVEKAIAEAEAAMPAEPPRRLYDDLLAAARQGQGPDRLAPIAARLARAANARRLHGDERYQSTLRPLQWAVTADPKSAVKLAALGQFLLDEVDVRGEYVDPGHHFVYYRTQTRAMQSAELAAARDCFQRALGASAANVAALMGMAQIKYRENLFGDAENYARSALGMQSNDPVILDLLSRLMRIAAGQAMARALAAATTRTWTEPLANGWERQWTQYGDQAAAERHAGSADGLLKWGDEYARRALQSLKDTPESYDYLGTRALGRKEFDAMRQAYERAVQKRPESIEYRYALANACAALGNREKYLEQATAGRNLEHTSVGAHLLAAWQSILQSDFKSAAGLLTQAAALDPGDARIPAYWGAMAEGQHQGAEAAACFRAALALEEAKGAWRAAATGAGKPACLFDETSLAVALRIRLARVIEEQEPAAALALYERNLAAEARLTSPEMLALAHHVVGRNRSETDQLRRRNHPMIRPLVDAMLPEPGRTAAQQSTPPNAAGLLHTSRGLAGVALHRLGRKTEAAEHFRRLDDYRKYTGQQKTGTQVTVSGIWTPRPVATIAADCLRELGVNPGPRRRP